MGVVANLKVRKSINTLLSSPDLSSPKANEAIGRLKEMKSAAIPKLIQTLNHDPSPVIVEALTKFVADDTIPLYIREIKEGSQCSFHIAKILSDSKSYNPNKLVEYLSDSKVPQASILYKYS